jgi:AcrR family transcriptional regulator
MQDARDQSILAAAMRQFSRYGVGKTTMHDIAKEAGVARQTLYNLYPGKNEILRGAVRMSIAQTFSLTEAAWETETTLDGKIEQFFLHGPLHWYDVIQSTPDVAELIDGMNAVAADELAQARAKWGAKFSNLITAHTSYKGDHDALGAYIYAMALNAKYGAPDRETVMSRLALLKASVLALTASEIKD